jgi:hypothetical protein
LWIVDTDKVRELSSQLRPLLASADNRQAAAIKQMNARSSVAEKDNELEGTNSA